jgi:type I restriction enzyme, R subunit
MTPRISEESFEYYILDELLAGLGYQTLRGEAIAPGEPGAEREGFGQVILPGRLRAALTKLNPYLPEEVLDGVFQRVVNLPLASPSTAQTDPRF